MFVLISDEPAQKCKNNAIFKQNYAPKTVYNLFKTAYSCCFS